jgi:hypothetical protein
MPVVRDLFTFVKIDPLMKIKFYFLTLLLLGVSVVKAQTTAEKFEKFARKQDSLFIAAYEQRNIKAYNKLLNEFLANYKKLSPTEQKNYSGYLNGAYYNLCCTYSLLNDKAMAVQYLTKAVDAGYFNYAHIQQDSDLDNIRNEKGFLEINQRLKSIGDFTYILKKAQAYNHNDNRPLPAFTYQPNDNANLAELRKAFKLDSIAGEGTEVFRIINLLNWIHYLIPHDGNHQNPVVKNAMSMIAECKKDKRGLNCRGLATVLNECYLSLGFKSKIITCLPKDSLQIDSDCHVINAVYSNTLKKWLWIDPTNNAYVMNAAGDLMSIEEVREGIITGKPLVLNPDANWNRQSITKENYLYNYMAKNLYMLEAPVTSKYNMETVEGGKTFEYVILLPLDFYAQGPDKKESKSESTNTTWVYYKTNNPALFWKAP